MKHPQRLVCRWGACYVVLGQATDKCQIALQAMMVICCNSCAHQRIHPVTLSKTGRSTAPGGKSAWTAQRPLHWPLQ